MRNPDDVSPHTANAHHAACCDPVFNWQDRQDFDFASRGLVHRPNDPDIRDQDGNIVWHHEQFEAFLKGDAPETVHPSLWRHALLNNFRGLFKVCDGVWQVRGESLASAWRIACQRDVC